MQLSKLVKPPRRLIVMTGLAAAIGVLGGVAAWVLLHLIGLITSVAMFGEWAWEAPSFTELTASPRIVIVAMLGATLVSLLARWSPVIRGHGIPETMEVVLTKQSRIAPRTAVAKPLSAALAIGTGAPFGAEGPIIVTGGALGSLIGQIVPVSASERKVLLAAGAAAGMAATFGAPLASVVLAIELLLFEFSTRAFIPLVVATSIAGGMHSALIGHGPLFEVPPHDYAGLSVLPAFAVLGIGAGLLATLINTGLFRIEHLYRKLPVGDFWHPIIGAAIFACIGLGVPRVLGVGYDVIGDLLADRLAVGTVALIAGAKLVAWWVALASGTSGGTLAPILMISAGYGSLFGAAVDVVVPDLGISPGAFAVVAMAATFGAATQATFTAMVFVFELTRDYDVILPLMGTCVLADLVARSLIDDSIMTEKLTRRGLRVHTDYEVDPFRTVHVGDLMTPDVESVPSTATFATARNQLQHSTHHAIVVVDDEGRCAGVFTSEHARRRPGADTEDREVAVADVVGASPAVTVGPQDLAITVLERMLESESDHIPVVDEDDRVVGICTRTDLLRVRASRFAAERSEPGWQPWRARVGRRRALAGRHEPS